MRGSSLVSHEALRRGELAGQQFWIREFLIKKGSLLQTVAATGLTQDFLYSFFARGKIHRSVPQIRVKLVAIRVNDPGGTAEGDTNYTYLHEFASPRSR